eukprot:scaffold14361_cov193-Ochromonas_danica.AAC.8
MQDADVSNLQQIHQIEFTHHSNHQPRVRDGGGADTWATAPGSGIPRPPPGRQRTISMRGRMMLRLHAS